jgi:hypothetical protein
MSSAAVIGELSKLMRFFPIALSTTSGADVASTISPVVVDLAVVTMATV